MVQVKSFNQSGKGFWSLMGPMFASALVKRELGISMSSDETYTWFLALDGRQLIGFCAVTPEKSGSRLRHVYVLPEFRDSGVATQLVEAAIAASEKPLHLSVRKDEADFYEKFGFASTGKARGQYVEMEHI